MDGIEFLDTPEAKLGEMTAHALFTRFTKPIFLDLYIPDEYNTRKLMFILRDILDGKVVKPKKVTCVSYSNEVLKWDSFKKLAGRVGQGIEVAFKLRGREDIERAYRNESWHVAEYVLSEYDDFGREHFSGWGTMFRYRDGKRDKWSDRTRIYFSSQENREFDRTYSLIAPFIGHTSAPAKIDSA